MVGLTLIPEGKMSSTHMSYKQGAQVTEEGQPLRQVKAGHP